jgi:hypothetical protein
LKEKIAIAKAARILKVDRDEFQKLIKDGQLETFEGKVLLSDLKILFPTASIDLNSVFQDLKFIQKAAYANRVQSRLLPNKGNLEKQLEKVRMRLLVEQQKSGAYSSLLEELMRFLIELRIDAVESERAIIDRLNHWLANKLREME